MLCCHGIVATIVEAGLELNILLPLYSIDFLACAQELERSRERLSAAEAEVESLKSRCEEAEEVLAQTTSTLAGIQSQVEAEDDKHMDKLQSLEADFDRVEASKKKVCRLGQVFCAL